jgi:hypothetical protein
MTSRSIPATSASRDTYSARVTGSLVARSVGSSLSIGAPLLVQLGEPAAPLEQLDLPVEQVHRLRERALQPREPWARTYVSGSSPRAA